ncbi:MAG: hypothetical protein ACRDJ5_11990 [Actinomycetota bacterium]
MSTILLLVLLGAWLAVFIPAMLSARREEPLTTSQRFKRDIEMIAPRRASGGRWVITRSSGASDRAARLSYTRTQERRARFLKILLKGAVASALAAVIWGGWLWELHIAVDLSLGVYVAMLVDAKRRRAETQQKVRSLQARRASSPRASLEQVYDQGGQDPSFFDQGDRVVRLDDASGPSLANEVGGYSAPPGEAYAARQA